MGFIKSAIVLYGLFGVIKIILLASTCFLISLLRYANDKFLSIATKVALNKANSGVQIILQGHLVVKILEDNFEDVFPHF